MKLIAINQLRMLGKVSPFVQEAIFEVHCQDMTYYPEK